MADRTFATGFDTNSYRGFVKGKSTNQVLADIAELKKAEAKKNIKAFGIMIVGTEMLGNLVEGVGGPNYNDCLNGVIAMANHCFDETILRPRIIPPPYLHITKSFFGTVPSEYEKNVLSMSGVVHDFKVDYIKAIEEHTKSSTFEDIKNYLASQETTFATDIISFIEGAKLEVKTKNPLVTSPKEIKKLLLDFINNGDYETFLSLAIIKATEVALNVSISNEEISKRAAALRLAFPLSVGFYKWISNEIVDKNIDMQSNKSKKKRWNWLWDYQVSFIMSDNTLDNRETIIVTADKDMTDMLKHFGYQTKVKTLPEYLAFLNEP